MIVPINNDKDLENNFFSYFAVSTSLIQPVFHFSLSNDACLLLSHQQAITHYLDCLLFLSSRLLTITSTGLHFSATWATLLAFVLGISLSLSSRGVSVDGRLSGFLFCQQMTEFSFGSILAYFLRESHGRQLSFLLPIPLLSHPLPE